MHLPQALDYCLFKGKGADSIESAPLGFGPKAVCCMQCYSAASSSCSPSMRMASSFAFFGVVGFLDFGLDAGCRFFEFWGELDVAVVVHTGAGRDETAHDDVFLEAAERVDRAVDAGFGEDARGFLEAGRRDEAVGGERRLCDAEQERTTRCRATTCCEDALLFHVEAEAVDLLLEQEVRVADVVDLDPAKHLTNDRFDVLVGDGDTLEAVDLLDFVDEVALQFLFAEDSEHVVAG